MSCCIVCVIPFGQTQRDLTINPLSVGLYNLRGKRIPAISDGELVGRLLLKKFVEHHSCVKIILGADQYHPNNVGMVALISNQIHQLA